MRVDGVKSICLLRDCNLPQCNQMKNTATHTQNSRVSPIFRHAKRGFTIGELLIVIVIVGLLASLAVPTVNRVRDALTDNAKVRNADKLNEYVTAIYNGGVDTTAWATGAAAIEALREGVTIPASVPGGATMQVRLEKDVNAAAYTFTVGTAERAPRFVAILGNRAERP